MASLIVLSLCVQILFTLHVRAVRELNIVEYYDENDNLQHRVISDDDFNDGQTLQRRSNIPSSFGDIITKNPKERLKELPSSRRTLYPPPSNLWHVNEKLFSLNKDKPVNIEDKSKFHEHLSVHPEPVSLVAPSKPKALDRMPLHEETVSVVANSKANVARKIEHAQGRDTDDSHKEAPSVRLDPSDFQRKDKRLRYRKIHVVDPDIEAISDSADDEIKHGAPGKLREKGDLSPQSLVSSEAPSEQMKEGEHVVKSAGLGIQHVVRKPTHFSSRKIIYPQPHIDRGSVDTFNTASDMVKSLQNNQDTIQQISTQADETAKAMQEANQNVAQQLENIKEPLNSAAAQVNKGVSDVGENLAAASKQAEAVLANPKPESSEESANAQDADQDKGQSMNTDKASEPSANVQTDSSGSESSPEKSQQMTGVETEDKSDASNESNGITLAFPEKQPDSTAPLEPEHTSSIDSSGKTDATEPQIDQLHNSAESINPNDVTVTNSDTNKNGNDLVAVPVGDLVVPPTESRVQQKVDGLETSKIASQSSLQPSPESASGTGRPDLVGSVENAAQNLQTSLADAAANIKPENSVSNEITSSESALTNMFSGTDVTQDGHSGQSASLTSLPVGTYTSRSGEVQSVGLPMNSEDEALSNTVASAAAQAQSVPMQASAAESDCGGLPCHDMVNSVPEANYISNALETSALQEAAAWPAGVNPGAKVSSQVTDLWDTKAIAPEKGLIRGNIHPNKLTRANSKSPVLARVKPRLMVKTSPIIPANIPSLRGNAGKMVRFTADGLLESSKSQHRVKSMLTVKHHKPAGPSIAFETHIPGLTRALHSWSKSKSHAKASSNAASSTNSNSNSITDSTARGAAGSQTNTQGRSGSQGNYGYGSGSGYGYGRHSWAHGGGGGWAGQPPPGGFPKIPNYGQPPSGPGIPNFPSAGSANAGSSPPAPAASAAPQSGQPAGQTYAQSGKKLKKPTKAKPVEMRQKYLKHQKQPQKISLAATSTKPKVGKVKAKKFRSKSKHAPSPKVDRIYPGPKIYFFPSGKTDDFIIPHGLELRKFTGHEKQNVLSTGDGSHNKLN